ncbi:MAG: hypothetical protein ABJG88_09470 [Litorimonas sp.]
MKTLLNNLPRIALLILAALGTLAGAGLSLEHLQYGEVCPMAGPIPACIIVFIGYLLIVSSTILLTHSTARKLFYIGWTPVFLLALLGVTLELGHALGFVQDHICPPGAYNIPQCVFSLAMVLTCLGLFKLSLRKISAT